MAALDRLDVAHTTQLVFDLREVAFLDIAGLKTKGELLIVAIVSAGNRSGLYYASIPDTTPELVQPARDALEQLQVDG